MSVQVSVTSYIYSERCANNFDLAEEALKLVPEAICLVVSAGKVTLVRRSSRFSHRIRSRVLQEFNEDKRKEVKKDLQKVSVS